MSEDGGDSRSTAQPLTNTSDESLMELLRQYRNGSKQAGDRLVEVFTPMVRKIAFHLAKKHGIEPDDLSQEGFKDGLLPALRQFDPQRHCKLSTYVWTLIQQAVNRYAGRNSPGARGLRLVEHNDSAVGFSLSEIPAPDIREEFERDEAVARRRDCILALPGLTRDERKVVRHMLKLILSGRSAKHRRIRRRVG